MYWKGTIHDMKTKHSIWTRERGQHLHPILDGICQEEIYDSLLPLIAVEQSLLQPPARGLSISPVTAIGIGAEPTHSSKLNSADKPTHHPSLAVRVWILEMLHYVHSCDMIIYKSLQLAVDMLCHPSNFWYLLQYNLNKAYS